MKMIKLTRDQHRAWRENAPGARDELRKTLLATNDGQPFRLMSSSGRFLGAVRGEKNTHTGTAKNVKNAMYAPENCQCRQFAGTPAGQHHPICQFKAKWEQAQLYAGTVPQVPGLLPGMGVQHMNTAAPAAPTNGVVHMQVAKQVGLHQPAIPTPMASPPVMVVTTPPPDQCECRSFTKDPKHDPKQHHVICAHFDRWKMLHPTVVETTAVETENGHDTEPRIPVVAVHDTIKPPADDALVDFVLVDLNSQKVLRDATGEEIASASAEEERSGSPFVKIDDTLYAVVLRSSLQSGHENNRTAD